MHLWYRFLVNLQQNLWVQFKFVVGDEEPTMKHLFRWSRHSVLRTSWYNFAVELVGKNSANFIKGTHYGDGSHSCLQRVLVTWYESTANHSWQIIVDALRQMDETHVIESIENECLISVRMHIVASL